MSPVPAPPIDMVPPELFPIIASFVPLRSAPNTLRSLALGNRRFYDIVRPLLYSRLILRGESHTIAVIQKILDEPNLGLAVREIYILSALSSIEAQKARKPSNIITGLHMLVKKQLVPRIAALGIFLLNGRVSDENSRPIFAEPLLTQFWSDLRMECPRLRTLLLRNIGYSSHNPWILKPMIDEINCISASNRTAPLENRYTNDDLQNLSVLRLERMGRELLAQVNSKILESPANLGSLLHTLSLESNYQNVKFLLPLKFPNLKWLSLSRFASHNAHSEIMNFLRRHPQLESLSLVNYSHAWFLTEIDAGLLPNLKHLKSWQWDIRCLAPILPQLLSLTIVQSYDGRTPYFIRSALRNGLPQLKSLEIELHSQDWGREGIIRWHENVNENCLLEKKHKKIPRNLLNCMDDIARLAPNLIELGLHGIFLRPESLQAFGPALSQLVNMERFYYSGSCIQPNGLRPPLELTKKMTLDFLSGVMALARRCTSLKSVTNINRIYYPYTSGTIDRDSVGNLMGVRLSSALGMQISAHEDDPFPCNL